SVAEQNFGVSRLSLSTIATPTLSGKSLPDAVAAALAVDPEKRDAKQKEALANYWRTIAPELAKLRQEIARLDEEKKKLTAALPTSLISMSGPPRTIRIQPRGNWLDDSGEIVQPHTPAFLFAPEAKERLSRLDLANWIVSRDNPLTARVFVNRLWKIAFGQGLVRSMEDF